MTIKTALEVKDCGQMLFSFLATWSSHDPLVNGIFRICESITLIGSTFIWHCCLRHKRHMEKFHRDGLQDSFDFESFDMCESCLLDKMTKLHFTSQGERTSELLALAHTDVCGLRSSIAKSGSCYKSESFEKFK